MKIPALHGTITVHGSQKDARNIERAIYKSQHNINSVETAKSNALEPSDMPKGKNISQRSRRNKISPVGECSAR